MDNVDVVFISWAKDEILRRLMMRALTSLSTSEKQISFHVYVVESNKDIHYDEFAGVGSIVSCKTLHPNESFDYHKFLNIGVREGSSPYVVLCNSDIVFFPSWSHVIIETMQQHPEYLSASPWSCPKSGVGPHTREPVEGYEVRKHVAGWCIFQQRKIYNLLGQLDERFVFWYADNDYAEELKKHKIKHCLVPTSRVDHHHATVGRTGASLNVKAYEEYTKKQRAVFVDKWGFEP